MRSALVALGAIVGLLILVGVAGVIIRIAAEASAPTAPQVANRPSKSVRARAVDSTQLDIRSNHKLSKEESVVNAMRGSQLFAGGRIADGECALTMDGDQYEEATQQDKDFLVQIFYKLCAGSYEFPGRRLPPNGLPFRVFNLAGDQIYSDTIVTNS